MQAAFKRWRLGEFAWSRELLPGGEQTAGLWEKTAVCTQRPGPACRESVGSHSLGELRSRLSLSWGREPVGSQPAADCPSRGGWIDF